MYISVRECMISEFCIHDAYIFEICMNLCIKMDFESKAVFLIKIGKAAFFSLFDRGLC